MTKFTNDQIAQIAQAVALALATIQAPTSKAKPAQAHKPASKAATKSLPKIEYKASKAGLSSKEERKLQLDLLAKTAFEAKGFTNVIPRVNVKTLAGWAAEGKALLPDQQPIWVKAPWMSAKQMGYPLFHATQVS